MNTLGPPITQATSQYSSQDEDDDDYDSWADTDSSCGSDHRLDEHIDIIINDPAEAIAQLERLHTSRVPQGENADLHLFMEALAEFVWPARGSGDPEGSFRDDHPVTKQLVSHGLCELIRSVTADALFDEGLDYVCSVLVVSIILLMVVNRESKSSGHQTEMGSPATPESTTMKLIASQVLQATWTARHLLELDDGDPEDTAASLARGLLLTFLPIISLPQSNNVDCVNYRNVAGLLWLNVDEEVDGPQDVIDSDKSFVTALLTFVAHEEKGWKGVKPFMESLCDVYGDLRVLQRLMRTYIQWKNLDSEELRYAFLYWTPRLLNTPRFYPHFKSTGILAAVRTAFDERLEVVEGRGDLHMEIKTVNSVVWMAYHLVKSAPFQDGAAQLVKQCDIFELMARFVILHAENIRELEAGGNPPRRVIDVFTGAAGALSMRSGKNELRKRFKLSLRREWYPTLKVLQETQHAGPQRDGLLEAWKLLGGAMNLDESQEKKNYEVECRRAAERRCSRSKCEYHIKKPPKTRVCVGCNEARYCSRMCQRTDWKEGGHRARCKRLKDVPRYFIEMHDREEERAAASALSQTGHQRRREYPSK